MLLKIWKFCEDYPDSLALVIRKNFVDLRDSTLRDFTKYFKVDVNSNKEFKLPNGSLIMFRHGSELSVLKNINLSIAGIEQAEEFDTDEEFMFIRDRLRRDNAPLRQLCIIANAHGHNWIWRLWKAEKPSEEYDFYEANTFENEDNLPTDFISDLKHMETEAPHHYRRMVLNDDEEQELQDTLINEKMLELLRVSQKIENTIEGKRIITNDPAWGGDENVIYVLENGRILDKRFLYEKDTMKGVGEISVLSSIYAVDDIIIDVIGSKALADRLKELKKHVIEFNSCEEAENKEDYDNRRTEAYCYTAEKIRNCEVPYPEDIELRKQLCAARYRILNSNGKVQLLPKDQMKKILGRSPDRADAFVMGIWGLQQVGLKLKYTEMLAKIKRDKEHKQGYVRVGGYG